jgi:hypothetical protein
MGWILPIIQAASAISGGVAGNKLQGQGLQASQDALNTAYTNTNKNLTDMYNQSAPWLQWGYNQQQNATNNALANTGNMLNFGLNQSNQYRTSGLNNSLASINNLAQQMGGRFDKYASTGNALGGLNKYLYGSPGPGSAINNGGGNSLANVGQAQGRYQAPYVPATQVNAPAFQFGSGTGSGTGGSPSTPNISNPTFNSTNSSLNPNTSAADAAVKNAMGLKQTATTAPVGDNAAQSVQKAVTAAGAGIGLGYLVAGAGGTGIGALVGLGIYGVKKLADHFTALGNDKVSATKGIDAISSIYATDWLPKVKSGQMTPEQLQTCLQASFNDWSKLLPEDVKTRSIDSQLYWFNQGLKKDGMNFQLSVPGYTANVNAGKKGYDQTGQPQ